jgi:hypothetical protein
MQTYYNCPTSMYSAKIKTKKNTWKILVFNLSPAGARDASPNLRIAQHTQAPGPVFVSTQPGYQQGNDMGSVHIISQALS